VTIIFVSLQFIYLSLFGSYNTISIPSTYTLHKQTHTKEAISQEAIVRKKADNVRAKKEEIELARDTTVEDLTKGLLNYRFTGLTFKRSEQGALRYVDFFVCMHA
jgi:hypothetical protein